MAGSNVLLGISRAEAYHQFGAPNVNFHSVLIYERKENVMILIFGVSDKNGSVQELTQGYIYGTLKDGVLECSGVNLLDTKDIPKAGAPLTDEVKKCIVADIGSTFYRPILFSKDLIMWQLMLNNNGEINNVAAFEMKDLLTKNNKTTPITSEQANTFYQKMMEKEE